MQSTVDKENALVIIGEEDVVLGFSSMGFKVYALKELNEFKSILDEVINTKAGICLIQDYIYSAYQEHINNYKKLPLPVFIPFSRTAQTGLLDKIVKDIRIRATGAF